RDRPRRLGAGDVRGDARDHAALHGDVEDPVESRGRIHDGPTLAQEIVHVRFAPSRAASPTVTARSLQYPSLARDDHYRRSHPRSPHSPVTMPRYSSCALYISTSALASLPAFSAVSANLFPSPPPLRDALTPASLS